MVQVKFKILEVQTPEEREPWNVEKLDKTVGRQRPWQSHLLPEKRISSSPGQVPASEQGPAPRGKVEKTENLCEQTWRQAGQPCHRRRPASCREQYSTGGVVAPLRSVFPAMPSLDSSSRGALESRVVSGGRVVHTAAAEATEAVKQSGEAASSGASRNQRRSGEKTSEEELPGDSGSATAVCFPRSVRLGSGEKMPEVARPPVCRSWLTPIHGLAHSQP